MTTEFEFHEAANIFPMDEEHIAELAADIKKHGQQVPIELLEGKIIDGRRRFKACQIACKKPAFRHVSVADPVAYVMSLNLYRRQLTPSQRSMAGARAKEIYAEQAKERQKEHGKTAPGKSKDTGGNSTTSDSGKARDLAGKAVGVSGSLIDRAAKVIECGVPELAKAVDEGRMSVSSAAELADQPAEVQKEVAEKAHVSGGRYRKPAVEPDETPEGVERGKGVMLAHQAVDILKRIPKNDALRKRGFQIVTDWIRKNK